MRMIEKAGTPGPGILLLGSDKLAVIYRSGELEDLQSAIEQDTPPIALIFTGELGYWDVDTPHAVVVAGFEGNSIVLNDPAKDQPNIRVQVDEFMLAWDRMGNLYALLKRK